jgi:peptide/nickel transport system substrate-binding protein
MVSQKTNQLNRRSLVAAAGGASALAITGLPEAALAGGANQGTANVASFQDANIPTPRAQTVVINQGTNNVWDSFNPFIPNGEAYNYGLAIICREYMFYSNFLTGEIRPWLATEYAYNEDFTQCTLMLNPNVKWNDGEPFTSDDVVFTQQLLLDNPQLNGAAGVIRDVKSVTATDPQTVVWELTSPNSRFHYRFIAGIIADGVKVMPKHIWEGEDPGTFKFNPPVQTGPYVLQEASSTQLYYVWEKNADYWNKAEMDPAPQFAIWRQATEVDAMVQEFLAGATDVPGIDYLNQQVVASQYEETASFDFPDPCTRGFYFNTDSPSELFATPEGRWALSHLIDREVIATTIWQPPTRPATYPWADYEGWQTWAPEEVMGQFDLTYNVDKANELLDALGATERDGDTRMLNGKPLRLTMITPAQTTGLEYQIGASFANTAKEAGIDIELKSLPGSAFGDAYNTGDYDITCHWICGMQFDPNQLYSGFHSRNYKPVGERTEGDAASARLQSPELDALIVELDTIDVEAEASKAVFNDALSVFMTELPAVPSIQTTYPMFFNTRYWTGWPSAEDPYTIPANWWGQFMFVIGAIQPTGAE